MAKREQIRQYLESVSGHELNGPLEDAIKILAGIRYKNQQYPEIAVSVGGYGDDFELEFTGIRDETDSELAARLQREQEKALRVKRAKQRLKQT
jgi:hypothetical protein